jgi:hypothetical protein
MVSLPSELALRLVLGCVMEEKTVGEDSVSDFFCSLDEIVKGEVSVNGVGVPNASLTRVSPVNLPESIALLVARWRRCLRFK